MPEFSVLLPTRNRYASANLAIQSVLSDAEDTELIVGDNGDKPLSPHCSDGRLRILRPDSVLAMPDNWERVVRAARGDWLLLLSDKCRLVPGALRILRDLAGSKYSAVVYQRTSFFQDLATEQFENRDLLENSPGDLVRAAPPVVREPRSSFAALREWYSKVDYTEDRPMLYTALINRSIVDRVLSRWPSFFVGMAPDVASGLRILSQSEDYLYTTVPATMIHYPSRRTQDWSTGLSLTWGTARGRKFIAEFQNNPLAIDALPPTGTSVVLQTLLAFRRSCDDAFPDGVSVDWVTFARTAAHEIERFPKHDRLRLQLALTRALRRQHDGNAAAFVQLKSLIVSRLPTLYALYNKLRISRLKARTADVVPSRQMISSAGILMDDALEQLAREIRGLSTRESAA